MLVKIHPTDCNGTNKQTDTQTHKQTCYKSPLICMCRYRYLTWIVNIQSKIVFVKLCTCAPFLAPIMQPKKKMNNTKRNWFHWFWGWVLTWVKIFAALFVGGSQKKWIIQKETGSIGFGGEYWRGWKSLLHCLLAVGRLVPKNVPRASRSWGSTGVGWDWKRWKSRWRTFWVRGDSGSLAFCVVFFPKVAQSCHGLCRRIHFYGFIVMIATQNLRGLKLPRTNM